MGLDFFKKFQKERKNVQKAIIPTYYMIRIQGADDLETVNILRTLAQRHQSSIPRDAMHYDEEDSNSNQTTIYFSIYGFEMFTQALKQNIIAHNPVDDEHTQFFKDIDVDLSIIANDFAIDTQKDDQGKEHNHYTFKGSKVEEAFDHVSLRADFLSATYFLYRLLFFNYSQDAISEMDVESTYDYLITLAKNLRADYRKEYNDVQGDHISDDNLPTLPSQQDFEYQRTGAVYIPSLNDTEEEADTSTPTSHDDDNDMRGSRSATDDDNQDPTESLTNNTDDASDEDDDAPDTGPHDEARTNDTSSPENDTSTAPDTDDDAHTERSSNDEDDETPTDDDDSEPHAKTVGQLRREQSGDDDTEDTDEGSKDADASQATNDSPEDIIKRMYAPKIYQMDIRFPQFSVESDMEEPPKLEEAVKHNDFDNQLYIVQETNHIKKQANEYLQNEAQQLNRNFNYDMGQLVMKSYKRMNDRIMAIMREGRDNQKLDQAIQKYYDQQSQAAFDELKQSKDQTLDQRLEALKREYEQKRRDIIAQSDQQYDRDRTNVKTQVQSDAARIRNNNIVQRDQDLARRVQDTKAQLEDNLNQFLQSKADRYKDMADNLGQRLFTALQNHIDANYPKLVNHVSILMNDQVQFNYSHKRLDDSNANVYRKKLDNYENRLKQSRQEYDDSINDYEDRIKNLRDRLNKRDDTSRGYDKLLTEKNDLQDHLDHSKQRVETQQKKINELKQQLDDAPLGQPDMTAKTRSVQLEYQSLQKQYRQLEDVNRESQDRIDELAQELDKKKHFWEKK